MSGPSLATARAAFESGAYGAALDELNGLMTSHPADGELLGLVAECMAALGHHGDAADVFGQAAEAGGPRAAHWMKRSAELHHVAGRAEVAQLTALRLLQSAPDDPDLVYLLVQIFQESGESQLVDALKYRLVSSDKPEHLLLAASLIGSEPNRRENLELFRKLAALFPDDPYTRFSHLDFAREFSDFLTVEREERAIRAALAAGNTHLLSAEQPHFAIMWLEDEALLRLAANTGPFTPYSDESRMRRRHAPHRWGDKLRIGYVSADFWDDHATMRLLGDVLRRHDPARFDVTLFCNTPERFVGFDAGGRNGWGRIVTIRDLDDGAAVERIRAEGIDILVDLKGHTGHHRAGIFNRGAAPVQVAWLGFPGSALGIDCDYIIGDRAVLPDGAEPHFHELFCRLPETYQPNDPVARIRPAGQTRAALGLPEDRFLFASFNASKKLSPLTFDVWARILQAAPEAHLWIMAPEAETAAAFARRGIGAERLHFAAKMAYGPHIARVQAADLGLDTFPCNGHTTTSDMLWAGLPVVTAQGQTFAGRVSESLLEAAALPELVAADMDDYVALAAGLARDPQRMQMLRGRLAENRFRAPLFDSGRFCRHLEAAFTLMAERARNGRPPEAFDVPALPPREGAFRPD